MQREKIEPAAGKKKCGLSPITELLTTSFKTHFSLD